jgi:hypothetical protein
MAAPQPSRQKITPPAKFNPLIIAWFLAALGLAIFLIALRTNEWPALAMNVTASTVSNVLAPVAFAAAVVERAVEIIVSPWRDAGASKLEKALAAIQARPADATKAADQQAASEALDEYRGATQKYAFAISLPLSLIVSMAGVRALQQFVDAKAFGAAASGQKLFFLTVDVALTALLLSGGADGIHSIVNAVTTFFDSTADRTSKPAQQG